MLLAQGTAEPTVQDRRDAVCRAMMAAPGLIRFAARFTYSIEDAEDAYQRAMEIALTRAPVTEHTAFTSWLHTVIRREAQQIVDARVREVPARAAELEEALSEQPGPLQPDAVMEWRERYHAVQDAILGLPDDERVCLMMCSAGMSHAEIGEMTGYSERQIRRAIQEGRAHLTGWEVRLRTGQACESMPDLIDRTLDEEATTRERRALSRHVRHCSACRATYRTRREHRLLMGSFVPVILLAGAGTAAAAPADPGLVMTWWERASGSAGAKVGQVMQTLSDAPALLTSTRAGASAVAVVAAGAIGTPLVIDQVNSGGAPASALVAQATVPTPVQPTSTPPITAPPGPTAPAVRRATTRPASTPKTVRTPSSTPTAGPTAHWRRASGGSAAAEFSP